MNIRKATGEDAAGIARVHVDAWRTTYRGIVPDTYLQSLSYETRTENWTRYIQETSQGRSSIFVAEDDTERIAGFAAGGVNRDDDPEYRGELYAIYILQDYQRHGIGRELTRSIVSALLATDINTMLLWVLAQNMPARSFYEALGGRPVRQKPHAIGGVSFEEVAYGWLDIHPLLARSRE